MTNRVGTCAICNTTNTNVYAFKAHDDPEAPDFYACARCFLKHLDTMR